MAYTVQGLLNTSVDDCKISLKSITDKYLVRELFIQATKLGHKTRSLMAYRRLNQLDRKEVSP